MKTLNFPYWNAHLPLIMYAETFDHLSRSSSADAGEPTSDFDDELNNCHLSPPDFNLLLPRLLSLCGEIQFGLLQIVKKEGSVQKSGYQDSRQDREIAESLKKIFPNQSGNFKLVKY